MESPIFEAVLSVVIFDARRGTSWRMATAFLNGKDMGKRWENHGTIWENHGSIWENPL